jgi:hypothetical protein
VLSTNNLKNIKEPELTEVIGNYFLILVDHLTLKLELISFLINLYNLLVLHGIMLLGFPSSMLEWKYLSRYACYDIGGAFYNVDIVLMYVSDSVIQFPFSLA